MPLDLRLDDPALPLYAGCSIRLPSRLQGSCFPLHPTLEQ